MLIERLAIIGTGGHAKVVVDALLSLGWQSTALEFYSEDSASIGKEFSGTLTAPLLVEALQNRPFHVAIGNNAVRQRIAGALVDAGALPFSIIHPKATASKASRIGAGSFLAAGAIVGPHATLGMNCIVNHGAIVDHDCGVADNCHVAPGATLGGGVVLDAGVLIGAGANVLPLVTIGAGAIIGAGAVVHQNVPAGRTYVGVPARQIQESRT